MIYHVISRADWDEAQRLGVYKPPSLADEGFIHFSTLAQVLPTAQRFYAGRDDLLLLAVDEGEISAEIRFEDLYNHGSQFPHLYAPLSPATVSTVYPFPRSASGQFTLPSDIR